MSDTKKIRKSIGLLLVVVGLIIARPVINQMIGNDEIAKGRNYEIAGATMGTTYTIKVVNTSISDDQLVGLKADVEKSLKEVNRQMSTYMDESEITLFNNADADTPFEISEGFRFVVAHSLEISKMTNGAFDPTVSPLIDIWGFGAKKKANDVPSDMAIKNALSICGYQNLCLDKRMLTKSINGLQLNLGAIAKGYGVDVIASLLKSKKHSNYMVEIGGEIVTAGLNSKGQAWKIGVEKPDANSLGRQITIVLNVADRGVATSGDYRNFFNYNGSVFSHVIDPATGYPTKSNVASVTVLAEDCLTADALATSFMVMGHEKGLKLVETLPNVDAFFLVRDKDGAFMEYQSTAFEKAIVK